HPALMSEALSARIRADLFLGEGFDADAAERALELESTAPPQAVDDRVSFKLGQWLRYVDDLDAARERLLVAEQQGRDEGDDSSLGNILLNRVIVETWAGEWQLAAELADKMIDAFEQRGVVSADAGLWRAYFHAHVGRWDDVEAAAQSALREEPIIN